jgi:hypothetical protein
MYFQSFVSQPSFWRLAYNIFTEYVDVIIINLRHEVHVTKSMNSSLFRTTSPKAKQDFPTTAILLLKFYRNAIEIKLAYFPETVTVQ